MEKLCNFEQLLGLSPDHFTIRSGQGNANSIKWLTLKHHEAFVWGEFNNKGRAPYQVFLDLKHMHFCCNCFSKKFPCQHIIGLHLLWHHEQSSFSETPVPKWGRAYQTRFLQQRHQAHQLADELISADELHQLKSGLAELERWLHDLIQNGLATLTDRKKEYWVTIANRMVDIQAVKLSEELLRLVSLGQSEPDWPEKYLKRISPLALLLMSFKRFEQQSLHAQADLLAALGRPFPMLKNGRVPLFDQWLVLGHFVENMSQQQQTTTWLWGLNHNQPAKLTQHHKSKPQSGIRHITGTILSGELQYFAGTYPLAAQFVNTPLIRKSPHAQMGETLIEQSLNQYKRAKINNPWLHRYPMILCKMTPLFGNERWFLIDEENHSLPLPQKYNYGWHLASLALDQTVATFGLWDGNQFDPISVKINGTWTDLHTLRGIK